MGHRSRRHSPGASARMPISGVVFDAPEEVRLCVCRRAPSAAAQP